MDENTNINVNGEAVENTTSTNEETKTFTQEEVLKLLQQEGDRRVSEALKKAQKNLENIYLRRFVQNKKRAYNTVCQPHKTSFRQRGENTSPSGLASG